MIQLALLTLILASHLVTLNGFASNFDPKIYAGEVAPPNSFPYQAELIGYANDSNNTVYYCGGSLISTRYVMTAAHCVYLAAWVLVILGAQNLSDTSESTQAWYVSSNIILHEEWDSDTLANDIAVLQLYIDVNLTEYIQPVTLPKRLDAYRTFVGRQAIVSGWGVTGDNDTDINDVLLFAVETVISTSECNASWVGIITDTQVCCRGVNNGSPCPGDSGSALVLLRSRFVQIGIVSYGMQSCEQNFPEVYTFVPDYLDWIESNTDVSIEFI